MHRDGVGQGQVVGFVPIVAALAGRVWSQNSALNCWPCWGVVVPALAQVVTELVG
jgi:hypothetical protein